MSADQSCDISAGISVTICYDISAAISYDIHVAADISRGGYIPRYSDGYISADISHDLSVAVAGDI